MAQPRTQRNGEEDNTNTLAYWMGRVDANILELKSAIEKYGAQNEGRWREFEDWRHEVDERLQSGSAKFEDHTKRLIAIETKVNGSAGAKFGTWEWFRDKYLEKGIYIILSLALYKLIEMLVIYWASLL